MLNEWLKDALDQKKVTQAELARHLSAALNRSIDRAAVNKMTNGQRKIAGDELMEISRFLGVPQPSGAPAVRTVRVAAFVQAGAWQPSWEWPYEEQYDVVVPADPALSQYRLWAAETRGTSMNRRYPEKTVVVFTRLEDTQEAPVPGRRYIVERRRVDGDCEYTVKTLYQDDKGMMWLLPESTDPLYQAPIPFDGNDGDTIEIIGRVRYSVSRE